MSARPVNNIISYGKSTPLSNRFVGEVKCQAHAFFMQAYCIKQNIK